MANILIVDDDPDMTAAFRDVLVRRGHNVRTAHTGQEGLESLRAAPLPCMVVLDVEMPVLDGPGMAHQMLLHDAGEEEIPVMLVSAHRDLAGIAGRMGTPYFLAKPATIEDFVGVVDRALREHAAPTSA